MLAIFRVSISSTLKVLILKDAGSNRRGRIDIAIYSQCRDQPTWSERKIPVCRHVALIADVWILMDYLVGETGYGRFSPRRSDLQLQSGTT